MIPDREGSRRSREAGLETRSGAVCKLLRGLPHLQSTIYNTKENVPWESPDKPALPLVP